METLIYLVTFFDGLYLLCYTLRDYKDFKSILEDLDLNTLLVINCLLTLFYLDGGLK